MNPKFTRIGGAALLALAIAALPAPSRATTLPPGGCIGFCVAPLSTVETLTASGASVASTGVVPFTGVDALGLTHFTGIGEENVIRDSTTGDLDFLFQFASLTGDPIANFSTTSFVNVVANVGVGPVGDDLFSSPGGTQAPNTILRNGVPGNTITFSFAGSGGVPNGVESLALIVKTDTPFFTRGAFNFTDGGVSTIAGFGPSPIPEPSSMALLCAGLLVLGGGLRRRKIATR